MITLLRRNVARMLRSIPALQRWRRKTKLTQPAFERFYAQEHDPFGFDRNPYEQDKFDQMLAALGGRRFASALEVGCSIGSFTERLASVCGTVVATDISQIAVDRTRDRLHAYPNVVVKRMTFPETPEGTFELVVCSDVLYYFPAEELQRVISVLATSVAPGGSLLLLHYLGDAGGLSDGERVHNLLPSTLTGFIQARAERRLGVGPHGAGYRLDRFDRVPLPEG